MATYNKRGEVEIDVNLMDNLWDISNSDSTIANCISLLIEKTHQGGLMFYANDQNLKLTPEFQSTVNEYWLPFSKDVIRYAMAIGVAFFTFLRLPNGDIVPKIVPSSTVRLCMRYDIASEKEKYSVYRRTHDAKNANEEIDVDDMYDQPREAMRVDLGTYIPTQDEPDPLVFVLDCFGYKPDIKTGIRSPVRTLLKDYTDYRDEMDAYRAQQDNVTEDKPYVAPKTMGEEFVRMAMADSYAPGDSSQSASELVRNRTIAEMQSYFTTEIYANQQRIAKGLGPSNTAIGSILSQLGALSDSQGSYSSYNIVPPGSTMSSYHASADTRHLPVLIKKYQETVRAIFQLPVGIFTEGHSSNQEMAQNQLESTIYSWYTLLTNVLTSLYETINIEEDNEWYSNYIQKRWLKKEAVERTRKILYGEDFEDGVRRNTKGVLSQMNSNKNARPGLSGIAPTKKIVVKHTGNLPVPDVIETTDLTGGKGNKKVVPLVKPLQKRRRDARAIEKRVLGSIKKRRQMENGMDNDMEDDVDEYDSEYTNESDREDDDEPTDRYSHKFYLEASEKAVKETKSILFENLPKGNEKREYSPGNNKSNTKRKIHDEKLRIKVTLARNTFLTIPQLTSMMSLGALDTTEFVTFLRSKANLQPHDGLDKFQKVLQNVHELLGIINVEQVMSDTALLPIFGLTKQRIIKNENEAIKKALREQEMKYELVIQKMKMEARQSMDAIKNAKMEGNQKQDSVNDEDEKSDKSTAPKRDKNGDMKKEQADEAKKSGALKAKAKEVGKNKMTDNLTSTGRKKGESRKGNATMAD